MVDHDMSRPLPADNPRALIPLDAGLPGALTAIEIEATMRYAEAEKAEATRAAYASDWRDFAIWCHARGATPLPAAPGMIAAYLAALATEGRRASTIGRKCAAIGHRHKLAGIDPLPTAAEGVRATLRGIRRTIGTATVPKAPATADLIGKMLDLCPDSVIGKRDRALLAFGFAGAFRRSELCALDVADLTEAPDGLRVLIRRSKGDQEGQGQEVAIPRGYRLRPVEALQTWLAAAEISAGPVFRAVDKVGRVAPTALATDSAARVVKRYAERVGLDPTAYAGHSLRSGFLTSAAEAGASVWKLAEVSRHRSLDTLRGYVRRVDLFREHAGAAFL
ncbi:MAG TPA: site-specific integrase [Stellaceae bacterium]|jgi:integrase|nr:site-specific integrase [Stellaceae bacterium]